MRKKKDGTKGSCARYDQALPPPEELAKIAAHFIGENKNDVAISRAIELAAKVYLACSEFRAKYEATGTAKAKALLCGDTKAALQDAVSKVAVNFPRPQKYPATFADFLKIVVAPGRDEADAMARMREFFKSRCPSGGVPLDYAEKSFEVVKATELDEQKWHELGGEYLAWRQKNRSDVNSSNAKKRVRKAKGAAAKPS